MDNLFMRGVLCHSHRVTVGDTEFHEPCLLSESQFFQIILNNCWSSDPLIFLYRTQSSAKRRTVEFMLSERLIMKFRNSIGPNTEPCGTPDNMGAVSEQTPSSTTFCVCPDCQAEIHWRVD